MDMQHFRRVLRDCRNERVGSQKKLAAKTAGSGVRPISDITISEIEIGTIADPGLTTIARLVEAMDLTLASFFAQVETGHASGSSDSPLPDVPRQVAGADPVSEKATPIDALVLSNEVIAEALQEIAKAIRTAAKPRRSTARTGTTAPKPPKASRKVG